MAEYSIKSQSSQQADAEENNKTNNCNEPTKQTMSEALKTIQCGDHPQSVELVTDKNLKSKKRSQFENDEYNINRMFEPEELKSNDDIHLKKNRDKNKELSDRVTSLGESNSNVLVHNLVERPRSQPEDGSLPPQAVAQYVVQYAPNPEHSLERPPSPDVAKAIDYPVNDRERDWKTEDGRLPPKVTSQFVDKYAPNPEHSLERPDRATSLGESNSNILVHNLVERPRSQPEDGSLPPQAVTQLVDKYAPNPEHSLERPPSPDVVKAIDYPVNDRERDRKTEDGRFPPKATGQFVDKYAPNPEYSLKRPPSPDGAKAIDYPVNDRERDRKTENGRLPPKATGQLVDKYAPNPEHSLERPDRATSLGESNSSVLVHNLVERPRSQPEDGSLPPQAVTQLVDKYAPNPEHSLERPPSPDGAKAIDYPVNDRERDWKTEDGRLPPKATSQFVDKYAPNPKHSLERPSSLDAAKAIDYPVNDLKDIELKTENGLPGPFEDIYKSLRNQSPIDETEKSILLTIRNPEGEINKVRFLCKVDDSDIEAAAQELVKEQLIRQEDHRKVLKALKFLVHQRGIELVFGLAEPRHRELLVGFARLKLITGKDLNQV